VRKVIAMIQKIASNETEWVPFWKNYGKVIKYGVLEDSVNKERLSKLLQFESSTGNSTTLQGYVDRFVPGQEEIYFLAGESLEHVRASPLLEKLEAKKLEVLMLTDPIDEYVFTQLSKFDGKYKLSNVAREGLKLPGDDKKDEDEDEEQDADWQDLLTWLTDRLKNRVRKVVVSKRLTKSPAALVAGTYGLTANMERIVKSQALGDGDPQLQYQPKPILEVNVKHPVLKKLRALHAANEEDTLAVDTANILFESSAVASGYAISDPQGFVQRMNRVLSNALGTEEEAQEEPAAAEDAKKEEEAAADDAKKEEL